MISVILCTYNRAGQLVAALEALKAQELTAGSLEIVVVDNNSKDDTRRVVEEAQQNSAWPIHYFFEPEQGKSFALNLALTKVKGDLLAFTDDDIVPAKNWAQSIYEAFCDPQVFGVGGKILPVWMNRNIPKWLSKEIYPNLALMDHGEQALILDRDRPYYGANMAFRKEVFNSIGVFRTDLGRKGTVLLGSEDTEIFKRAYDAGYKLIYDPGIFVHHIIPLERMKKGFFRSYSFRMGQTTVLTGKDNLRAFRKILGIPTWRLREYVSAAGGYVKNITDPAKSFVCELKVLEFFGYVFGLLTTRKRETGIPTPEFKQPTSKMVER